MGCLLRLTLALAIESTFTFDKTSRTGWASRMSFWTSARFGVASEPDRTAVPQRHFGVSASASLDHQGRCMPHEAIFRVLRSASQTVYHGVVSLGFWGSLGSCQLGMWPQLACLWQLEDWRSSRFAANVDPSPKFRRPSLHLR